MTQIKISMPPFAESVIYVAIEEINWHISEYGIVIYAKAAVRIYFSFGDLFETFINSPNFDPFATGVPLPTFHENVEFPPQNVEYAHPPRPQMFQYHVIDSSDQPTPDTFQDYSYTGSNFPSDPIQAAPLHTYYGDWSDWAETSASGSRIW